MRKDKISKHGMSVLTLTLFVLLALGSGSRERSVRKETNREMQARAEREKAEREEAPKRARGFIEVISEVTGTVLLNRKVTAYTVSSGGSADITIDNANGEYAVAVRDGKGTVYPARNPVRLRGGSQEIVLIEDPNYVTSPNDLEFMQNTAGGITITGYKGSNRKVVIPGTISGVKVTAIGEGAFTRKTLTRLVIPNTVTTIGKDAFSRNYISSLTIPNSVTSIGEDAFSNCELSSLILGNRLTYIGVKAFAFNSLENIIIPASLREISDGVFRGNKLTSITIPNSVTSIGNEAFSLNNLTTVTIPNNVTAIGKGCFVENPINTIVISSSLTRFSRAFFNAKPEFYRYDMAGFFSHYNYGEGEFSGATSITLPANVDNENLRTNFEQGFVNFYINQNKKAGVYTKDENRIWRVR
jgi:hypothetical protein